MDNEEEVEKLDVIGKIVKVTVDRPMGSYHPNHRDIYYPVNYGYIKGIMSPDGEEQDAYILGIDHPVDEFTGRVIAVIHRYDDIEEKWVVAPVGKTYSAEEIKAQVDFQEQYFNYEIRT
ncbi:inorganic diphosphatase [Mediterraneibacter glycyrrhizinilyticus]